MIIHITISIMHIIFRPPYTTTRTVWSICDQAKQDEFAWNNPVYKFVPNLLEEGPADSEAGCSFPHLSVCEIGATLSPYGLQTLGGGASKLQEKG